MTKKYVLSNGVRIMFEPMEHMRSTSIGFWIQAGSINESKNLNGISHFIEHMVFKGTEKRSAKDIASEIDDLGGELNAFTSKECTCIYAKVLSEDACVAAEIIADMLMHSTFDSAEIEKEKMIVLDEINLYDDTPEEMVYDNLSYTIFKEHPLQMPILGTKKTVSGFNREKVIKYFNKHYTPNHMVVAVAGSFDEVLLMKTLEETIGRMPAVKAKNHLVPEIPFKEGFVEKNKDFEQVHLMLAFRGFGYDSEALFPFLLLNNVVGGISSSRLFQKIREDYGLSYTIDSHPSFYYDSGFFTIYASMLLENVEKVVELMIEELNALKRGEISEDELKKFRNQLKGSFVLGMEGPTNMMNWIGKSELLSGKIRTIEEVQSGIAGITREAMIDQANYIFNKKHMALSIVGKLDDIHSEKLYGLFQELMID